jgi:urea carboxylase
MKKIQIHTDGAALPRSRLLGLLREIEAGLPAAEDVPGRSGRWR